MMLLKRLIFVVLLVSSSVRASTTTLTGTILDAQGNGVNGRLTMQLPVPAQDTASNTALTPAVVQYRLVNGIVQAGPPLYDVAGLQPANLYYIAKVYDSTGSLVMWANYVVTGATFNIGAAIPTSITTSNISFLNPASLTGNNTFTGSNTFTQQLTLSVPTGTAPLAVTSTTLVPNLNVNLLNGVTVSGTPAVNSFLQATSTTAATWSAPTGLTSLYPNASVTGTGANLVAKLTGAGTVVTTATTDTGGAVGICVSNCGTTGSAGITTTGQASCIFDGATTQDDYVQMSGTVAGNCHDAGAAYPGTGQIMGRVLSTNAAGGTYNMTLFSAEMRGSVPSATIQQASTTTLAAGVAVSGLTQITGLAKSVTMPVSGCPCRVFVSYALRLTSTSSETIDADVTDGTPGVNHFAPSAFNMTGSTSYSGIQGSGWSPVTYANGAVVTFQPEIQDNNAGMSVQAAANFPGFLNSLINIVVVTSN